MFPPQIPSRLKLVPYLDIFNIVKGSSEVKRATPRFFAASSSLSLAAAAFSAAVSLGFSGSMLSKKPAIFGVLPSSEMSELGILMCRHAGLSTERFQEPWMSDTVGPLPHRVPDVVSST